MFTVTSMMVAVPVASAKPAAEPYAPENTL
jgi:hypothetical protein